MPDGHRYLWGHGWRGRPMIQRLFLALACAAFALPLQAQQQAAQDPQADVQAVAAQRVWRNYQQRVAALLAETGQPRDLALAAVLHDLASIDAEGQIPDNATTAAWRRAAAED